MPPLSQAKATTLVEERTDGTKVYSAVVDPDWTVASVPFGGYTFALVVNAALQFQKATRHQHPVHVTLYFLRALGVSPLKTQVVVKPVRPSGGRFTHLQVDLIQEDGLKCMAHLIFGTLDESGPSFHRDHQPTCPLATHPSQISLSPKFPIYNFQQHYQWAIDSTVKPVEDTGVRFGAWTEMLGDGEEMEADTLGFFLDISAGPFSATSMEEKYGYTKNWWYPTIVMSLEFKVKFPIPNARGFAPLTLGHASQRGLVLNGRHNDTVELWTAPCALGDSGHMVEVDWREKMECVAVGGQMGLIVSPALNSRHSKPKL